MIGLLGVGEAGVDLLDPGSGRGEHLDRGAHRRLDLRVVRGVAQSGENAIRTPARSASGAETAARNDPAGVGSADQSRGSKPHRMSSSAAASGTLRVIGPAWESVPNGLGG